MTHLPDETNLHGTLRTHLSKSEIARAFARNGWSTRRCGHDEWELTCEFAELVLEGDGPLLLHGSVASIRENLRPIVDLLSAESVGFSLECYDGETLFETLTSTPG